MSPKKITKHQMKEDKLVNTVFKVWEWARLHTKQLGIVSGSVVVLLLIAYLYTTSRATGSRKAAELFGQATIEMQSSVASEIQAAVSNLQIVIKDYPKSKWASYACFYLANLLFQDGQYPAAREYFQRYLNQYGDDSLLTGSAYAGIAECLRQEKDYLSAAEYYIKGAEAHPGSLLAPEYLLEAGRRYLEADQRQKAVEVFHRLVRDYPKSSQAKTAREELSQILIS